MKKDELLKKLSTKQIMLNAILNSATRNIFTSPGVVKTWVVGVGDDDKRENATNKRIITVNGFTMHQAQAVASILSEFETFSAPRLDRNNEEVVDTETGEIIMSNYSTADEETLNVCLNKRATYSFPLAKVADYHTPSPRETVNSTLDMRTTKKGVTGLFIVKQEPIVVEMAKNFDIFGQNLAQAPSEEVSEAENLAKEAGI